MALVAQQKKKFRAIGHKLNPIVTIAGNGLSEGVLSELDRALEDHELIKVKLSSNDRAFREQAIHELTASSKSALVQVIGKVAILLRRSKKPNPKLSNLLRK